MAVPTDPSMAPINRAQVLHVAKLAKLLLDEDEVPIVTAQLAKILEHIAQLEQVDTEGIEPTSQVGVDRLPLRSDESRPCLSRDAVLAEAPETAQHGFVVPAFVED